MMLIISMILLREGRQCLKIIVHGQVQGVGFRYGTLQIANRLTITGTVQNLSDGTVKIIAEGNHSSLEKFIHLIKTGPTPFARVADLQIEELPPYHYQLFMIK